MQGINEYEDLSTRNARHPKTSIVVMKVMDRLSDGKNFMCIIMYLGMLCMVRFDSVQ